MSRMFTRSLMLAAMAGVCIPHELYAAPKSAGANKAPPIETGNQPPAPVAPPTPQNATAAAFAAGAPKMEFEIEDDIPLPVKRVGVKGQSQYPYERMNVNQSFFVPVTEKMAEPWKTLTSLSSRMTRELWPKRFVTERQKNKDGVEGVRVWRTADGEGPLPEKRKSPKKAEAETPPADPANPAPPAPPAA